MRLLRNLAWRRLRTALVRRLNREHAETFVLVTHDAVVGGACDRIIRMRDGLVRSGEMVDQPTPGDAEEAAA